MLTNVRKFDPEKVFRNKRIAIIGAASSVLDEANGDYIESFDIVVRVNKAIVTWKPEMRDYVGKKTDVLFHSFYENEESGGGPIDLELFGEFGVEYIVNPLNNSAGFLAHLNYYKRKSEPSLTYILSRKMYRKMVKPFRKWRPTVGFAALYAVLNSPAKEVYVTGFTFFKTPYAGGYRDHLIEEEANARHIERQGLHNPDLEFELFKRLLKSRQCGAVICDEALGSILDSR